ISSGRIRAGWEMRRQKRTSISRRRGRGDSRWCCSGMPGEKQDGSPSPGSGGEGTGWSAKRAKAGELEHLLRYINPECCTVPHGPSFSLCNGKSILAYYEAAV